MTDREFFLETLRDEMPRFKRVFDAVQELPKEKLDYRPDPKSRNAFELLVHTFGAESSTFPIFLTTGKIDFATLGSVIGSLQGVDDVVTLFEKSLQATDATVSGMSEEQWSMPAQMLLGEKVEWETTRGRMAWSLLLDLIHHRGQLSTYLRPMGGKVPSIYGPSADSK
jgi:uncharacterized damage-inducible protein DinB